MTPNYKRFTIVYLLVTVAMMALSILLQVLFSMTVSGSLTSFIPLIGAAQYEGQKVTEARGLDLLPKPRVWAFARWATLISFGVSAAIWGLTMLLPGAGGVDAPLTPTIGLIILFLLSVMAGVSILAARWFFNLGAKAAVQTAERKARK